MITIVPVQAVPGVIANGAPQDDVREFAKELMEQSDELSDEELEIAAGGTAAVVALIAFLVAVAAVGGGAAAGGAGLAMGVMFTSMVTKK